mmetsp:Transcript_27070/g.50722  ORF Transcript_27070/g.50722 Transcript_27070/m.50722 type:complete len:541 (+) Transcript_27070:59-1681(+)
MTAFESVATTNAIDNDNDNLFFHLVVSRPFDTLRDAHEESLVDAFHSYYEGLLARTKLRERIKDSIQQILGSRTTISNYQGHAHKFQGLKRPHNPSSPKSSFPRVVCIDGEDPNFYRSHVRYRIDWGKVAFLHSILFDEEKEDINYESGRTLNKYNSGGLFNLSMMVAAIQVAPHEETDVKDCTKEIPTRQGMTLDCFPMDSKSWWNRPMWSSWTNEERILAHGAIAATEFAAVLIEKNLIDDSQSCWLIVSNTNDCHVLNECTRSVVHHVDDSSSLSPSSPQVIMILVKRPTRMPAQQSADLIHFPPHSQDQIEEDCGSSVIQGVDTEEWSTWSIDDDEEGQGQEDCYATNAVVSIEATEEGNLLLDESGTTDKQMEPSKSTEINHSLPLTTPNKEQNHHVKYQIGGLDTALEVPTDTDVSSVHIDQHILTPSPTGETTRHEVKKPQIDSAGIDLTMLRELPLAIRSEARLAMVLAKQQQNKRQRAQIEKHPVFERWLSTKSTGGHGQKIHRDEHPPVAPAKPRKRPKQGIERYFQKCK